MLFLYGLTEGVYQTITWGVGWRPAISSLDPMLSLRDGLRECFRPSPAKTATQEPTARTQQTRPKL